MSKTTETSGTAATGNEVAPWDEAPTGLAVIEATPEQIQQAKDAIINGTVPPELGDPNVTARAILERIAAGSLEESMNPAEQLPNWAQTLLNEPVVVRGFHLNKSTKQQPDPETGELKGPAVYAVVDLQVIETLELVTRSTGGANVLMQLVKALEDRAFPFTAVMTSTPTAGGNDVLRLIKPQA